MWQPQYILAVHQQLLSPSVLYMAPLLPMVHPSWQVWHHAWTESFIKRLPLCLYRCMSC
jgi:hypothetical protein